MSFIVFLFCLRHQELLVLVLRKITTNSSTLEWNKRAHVSLSLKINTIKFCGRNFEIIHWRTPLDSILNRNIEFPEFSKQKRSSSFFGVIVIPFDKSGALCWIVYLFFGQILYLAQKTSYFCFLMDDLYFSFRTFTVGDIQVFLTWWSVFLYFKLRYGRWCRS